MESLQLIKNRIHSIGSTRQITQSMRLVSTSKVQKAKLRVQGNQAFRKQSQQLLKLALDLCRAEGSEHPYITGRQVRRTAIVVIGGDRGLCGGYNGNIGKETVELVKKVGDSKVITVGLRTREYCRRRLGRMLAHSYTGISEAPFYEDVRAITDQLIEWYDSREVDQVYMVYTRFHSMLLQTPAAVRLLPFEQIGQPEESGGIISCEPSGEAFLRQAVPFAMTSAIHGAILESSICEQSARITSMDSAVKNADEMINSLTLRYNQARQSSITQEIIEIVGGAGAV